MSVFKMINCKYIVCAYDITTLLVLFFQVHTGFSQQCGLTSFHVTAEDGTQQVFTVKAVDPADQGCVNCQNKGSSSDSSSPLYAHADAIEYLGQHVGSTTKVFNEVWGECGKILDVNSLKFCVM